MPNFVPTVNNIDVFKIGDPNASQDANNNALLNALNNTNVNTPNTPAGVTFLLDHRVTFSNIQIYGIQQFSGQPGRKLTFMSDAVDQLPMLNPNQPWDLTQRINPQRDARWMPKIITTLPGTPALAYYPNNPCTPEWTGPGVGYFRFWGIEFAMGNAHLAASGDLPLVHIIGKIFPSLANELEPRGSPRDGNSAVHVDSDCPHDFEFDQCYAHSFPPGQSIYGCKAAFLLNGNRMSLTNSYVEMQSNWDSSDNQTVNIRTGSGPLYIYNNYLAASGETIMIGGSGFYQERRDGILPQNINIKYNTITKNLAWNKNSNYASNPPVTRGTFVARPVIDGCDSSCAIHYGQKNLLEFKICAGADVQYNFFQFTWNDAQDGTGVIANAASVDYGAGTVGSVNNVTIKNNIFDHVLNVFQFTQYTGYLVNNMTFENNLVTNMVDGQEPYPMSSALGLSGASYPGKQLAIVPGDSIRIANNTMRLAPSNTGTPNLISADARPTSYPTGQVDPHFVLTNNILDIGSGSGYGYVILDPAQGALPQNPTAWNKAFPSCQFFGNIVNHTDAIHKPYIDTFHSYVGRYNFTAVDETDVGFVGPATTPVADATNPQYSAQQNALILAGNSALAPSSRFKGKAYDATGHTTGADPGCNIAALIPGPSGPAVSFTVTASSPQVGQTGTIAITMNGNQGTPTGTITLALPSGFVGSPTPTSPAALTNSSVTFTLPSQAAGSYAFTLTYTPASGSVYSTASYSGSISWTPATLPGTVTTLAPGSPNPSQIGGSVNFTATVQPQIGSGTPMGTVRFLINGTPAGSAVSVVSNMATFSTTFPAAGNYTITASYQGDNNWAGSLSNAVTQTVQMITSTTTTLVSSLNPSTVGQAVTFTATVAAAGSGQINFVNFETGDFSQVASHVAATIVTSPALSGTYSLQLLRTASVANAEIRQSGTTYYNLPTAYYSFLFRFASQTGEGGIANFQDTASNYKAALHLSAAGKLLFYDINGTMPVATGATTLVANQTYTLTAMIGTGTNAAWSISVNGTTEISGTNNLGTVNNGSIKLGGGSPYTTNYYYDDVTISAAVATPTGTVQFAVDGSNTGNPVAVSTSGGVTTATYTTSAIPASATAHTVTGSYSGDTNFSGSTGILANGQVVNSVAVGPVVDGTILIPNSPSAGNPSAPAGIIGIPPSGAGFDAQVLVSTGAPFSYPLMVRRGADGQLYVLDFTAGTGGQGALIKVNPNTGTATIFAQGVNFNGSNALAVTAGFAYVAMSGGSLALVEIDLNNANQATNQRVLTSGGSLMGCSGLVVGPSNNVYWADEFAGGHGTIFSINRTNGSVSTLTTGGMLNQMQDFGMDGAGNLVAFNYDGSIITITPAGVQTQRWGSGGSLVKLSGGTVDTAHGGNIYVTESTSPSRIVQVTPAGVQSVVSSDNQLGTAASLTVFSLLSTTTTLSSSVNPSVYGQAVAITATVASSGAGNPTGSVQFQLDGANLGSPLPVNTQAGVTTASTMIGSLAVGNHTLTATYQGDGTFTTSTGTLAGGQTINKASTTTAVSSSLNPSSTGQSVTFTATITVTAPGAATPTGTVQFLIDGTGVGSPAVSTVGGITTATYQTSTLPVGMHTVTAVYSGDSHLNTSTGALAGGQTVNGAGMVVDGTILVASSPKSGAPAGTPTGIVAIDPSTGAQSLFSSGGSFSLPYMVREAPNGQIYVVDYNAGGTGAIIKVDPATGQQTAVYSGGLINLPTAITFSGNLMYVANTGGTPRLISLDLNVSPPAQRSISASSSFNSPVGLVMGSGNNIFLADEYALNNAGAIFSVDLTTGVATTLTSGGSFNHLTDMGVDTSGNLIVYNSQGGQIIRVNPNTGAQTILASGLAAINGGTVDTTHGDGGTQYLAEPTVPSRVVKITSGGIQSTLTSGGNLSAVDGIMVYATPRTTTTTSVTSSVNPSVRGQTVTLTATISSPSAGTPTGTVQFVIDGANAGSPVAVSTSGGVTRATYSISSLSVGTHPVTANYSGDSTFAASGNNLAGGQVVTGASTSTAVSSSNNPATAGQPITLTATVTVLPPGVGTPTGQVQFVIDNALAGSPVTLVTAGGVTSAGYGTAALAAGTHTVTASYLGDGNFLASTGTLAGGQVITSGAPQTGRVNFVGFETQDWSECYASSGAQITTTQALDSLAAARLLRSFTQPPGSPGVAWIQIGAPASTGIPSLFAVNTVYYRFYLLINSYTGEFGVCNCYDTSGNGKLYLHVTSTGLLVAYDSHSGQLWRSNVVLALSTKYRIEIQVGTGSNAPYGVRLYDSQGTLLTSVMGFSNLLGFNPNGLLELGGRSAYVADIVFDDVAVDSGGWIGGGSVTALHASGAGTYSQWAQGTAPSDYTQVRELVPDGDLTYVATNILNAAFTVLCDPAESAGIAGAINSVKACALARNASAGTCVMRQRIRSGNMNFYGDPVDPGTSYTLFADVLNIDPATLQPWTLAGVDNLEVGMENLTGGTGESRLTYVAIMVDYTAGTGNHYVDQFTGGALVSTVADVGYRYTIQVQGGPVISGVADIHFFSVVGGSGGLLAGAPADVVVTDVITPVGGVLAGALADRRFILAGSAVGGLVVSGVADMHWMAGQVPIGGALTGSFADRVAQYAPTVAGGVFVSGQADVLTPWAISGTGGVVVSTVADIASGSQGSGGVLVSSQAKVTVTSLVHMYTVAAVGGAAASTTADVMKLFYSASLGGVVASAVADYPAVYVLASGGGAVTSSQASCPTIYAPLAQGGSVLSSQGTVTWGFVSQAVGGTLVSGVASVLSQAGIGALGGMVAGTTADVFPLYNRFGTGGAVLGALTATVSSYNIYPTSGVLVSSNADCPAIFAPSCQGGTLPGGVSVPVYILTPGLPSGGVLVSSQADLKAAYGAVPVGGLVVSANAKASSLFVLDGKGGISVSAVADYHLIARPLIPSGGGVVGSQADLKTKFSNIPGSGGMVVSIVATADSTSHTLFVPVGGVDVGVAGLSVITTYNGQTQGGPVVSAVADAVATMGVAGQGGSAAGSQADMAVFLAGASGGGGVMGGTVQTTLLTRFTAGGAGGVVLGSLTNTTWTIAPISTQGGMALGSVADAPQISLPASGGGIVVSGAVDQPLAVFAAVSQGGVLVGSSADLARSYLTSGQGGLIVSSASDQQSQYTVSVGGGVLAGSQADGVFLLGPQGMGGVVVGSTAFVLAAYAPAPGGGGVLGGVPALATTMSISIQGGSVVSGVATIMPLYATITGGGLVASTVADVNFGPLVRGGVAAGSSSNVVYSGVAQPAGGVTVGGNVRVNLSLVASGGLLAGSQADVPFTSPQGSRGGVVAGSVAQPAYILQLPAQGGSAVGSTAAYATQYTPLNAMGGMVAGGFVSATRQSLSLTQGGLVVGGVTAPVARYQGGVTGGALTASTSSIAATYAAVVGGGLVTSSTATVIVTYAAPTGGGVVTSVVATGANNFNWYAVSLGGAVVGGVADIVAVMNATPAGGVSAGSVASALARYLPTPQGGVVGGSMADLQYTALPSSGGGIVAGSVSVVVAQYGAIPLGGAAIGSHADMQCLVPSQGGVAVGSSADYLARYFPTAMGGVVSSAVAACPTTYAAIAGGGLAASSTATVIVTYAAPTGGGVVSSVVATGANNTNWYAVSLGGVVVAGVSGVVVVMNATPAGGSVLGSLATVVSQPLGGAQGGVVAGSLSTVVTAFSPVSGGGAAVAALAGTVSGFTGGIVPAGGVVVGGALSDRIYRITVGAQGGMVAGGLFAANTVASIRASGGLLAGGNTDVTVIQKKTYFLGHGSLMQSGVGGSGLTYAVGG